MGAVEVAETWGRVFLGSMLVIASSIMWVYNSPNQSVAATKNALLLCVVFMALLMGIAPCAVWKMHTADFLLRPERIFLVQCTILVLFELCVVNYMYLTVAILMPVYETLCRPINPFAVMCDDGDCGDQYLSYGMIAVLVAMFLTVPPLISQYYQLSKIAPRQDEDGQWVVPTGEEATMYHAMNDEGMPLEATLINPGHAPDEEFVSAEQVGRLTCAKNLVFIYWCEAAVGSLLLWATYFYRDSKEVYLGFAVCSLLFISSCGGLFLMRHYSVELMKLYAVVQAARDVIVLFLGQGLLLWGALGSLIGHVEKFDPSLANATSCQLELANQYDKDAGTVWGVVFEWCISHEPAVFGPCPSCMMRGQLCALPASRCIARCAQLGRSAV